MVRSFSIRGFRVREVPHRESDVYVHVITDRLGTLRAIVRGLKRSRRRFPGSVRKFCLYDFQVKEERGGLYAITGAKLIESYEELALVYEKYLAADYIFEIISRMYPESVDSAFIFSRLLEFLDALREKPEPALLVAWMEICVLADSGYLPPAARCSICGKKFTGERVLVNRERYTVSCMNCRKEGKYVVVSRSDVESFLAIARTSSASALDLKSDGIRFQLMSVRRTLVERLGYVPKSMVEVEKLLF